MEFSRRLDWEGAPNVLALAEKRRRESGAPIFDLSPSNPTLVGLSFEDAEDLAAALADPQVAFYHPEPLGHRAAREAVAQTYARRSGGTLVSCEDVALTTSTSESYTCLFKLLCDPGDTVLVPEPSYPLFEYLARLEGVVLRPYALAYDGRWHIDWSSFDVRKARAIVVVNPNNPTGSFVTGADWRRLGERAAAAGAALLVDEVFADYTLAVPPDALASVLDEPSSVPTFVLGGLSKSGALPQMKLGWTVFAGPGAVAAEAKRRWEIIADTYLSVSTPVALAAPRLLEIGRRRRQTVQQRLGENLARLRAAFSGTPCTLLPVEGGWSAILRVPATRSDEEWALDLLERDGILVQPGYLFDLTGLGSTLVLSLLTDPLVYETTLATVKKRFCAGSQRGGLRSRPIQ